MAVSADEICYLSLLDLAARMHTRELSPVEVTEAMLGRIDAMDAALGSYVLTTPDLALQQAKAAETEIQEGRIRGPLHGAPIALKDLCWTKGIATAAGTTILADHVPEEDGTVTRRLSEAGTVCLGKLKTTEGAFADHHPTVEAPRNPFNADHWSGVSSSGSGVATAAGLCFGAIGTDTGGSIRFPSAANGVTGLKPTWGRVSRYGVFELAATLDHVGPMARSAADAGAMLDAIAGPDPFDPTAAQRALPDCLGAIHTGVDGLVIGIDRDFCADGTDSTTAAAFAQAVAVLEELGAVIRDVRMPASDAVVADWAPLCGAEAAVAHEPWFPERRDKYGPGLAGLLDLGRGLSGLDYQKIVLRRNDFRGRMEALFTQVDLLVLPAQTVASPTVARMATLGEDAELLKGLLKFTCIFDMAGSPTITLPCGFTDHGTPVAFQIAGPHWSEALLVRAGHAFQKATEWHRRHPSI